MTTTTNYLIIFQKNDEVSETQIVGMKLFDKNESIQFMKCVEMLADNGISFDCLNTQMAYDPEDFLKMKLTGNELKTLNKLFGLEEEMIGVFPDAITDAYENNLFNDEENSENEYEDDSEEF